MNVDIAKKYNGAGYRTKIGEGNVVEGMLKYDAIIGGEGNGGVIYPIVNTARDSFTGLALILELLAERKKTVSECVSLLPKYFIKKDKWSVIGKDLNEMYQKLKINFKDVKIDEQDGIRLEFPDSSWIHLRSSNTEPIIRLIGEGKSEETINTLFEQVRKILI
jgi:phosphomannomutase